MIVALTSLIKAIGTEGGLVWVIVICERLACRQ